MSLSDKTIIDNTHFREKDGKLYCYTLLPNEDKFEQAVTSAEAVQKNMIGWCNTVREYVSVKEQQREDAILKAKRSRELDEPVPAKTVPAATKPENLDARRLVMDHFDNLQQSIDQLGEEIEKMKAQRNAMRDERDKLQPIITVWRGE